MEEKKYLKVDEINSSENNEYKQMIDKMIKVANKDKQKADVTRDKKAELYMILADEVAKSFSNYCNTIKSTSMEELNNMEDLVELVEEQQPIRYSIFISLLNSEFIKELTEVQLTKLIDYQLIHGTIIKDLADKLSKQKENINIFNEDNMEAFIKREVTDILEKGLEK